MADKEISEASVEEAMDARNAPSFFSVIRSFSKFSALDGDSVVNAFIERRHRHFGAQDVVFVEDFAQAEVRNGTTLFASAANPLTDFRLVSAALEKIANGAHSVTFAGAIPGTQVERIVAAHSNGPDVSLTTDAQARYNTQFNLYKAKRLKMFLLLLELEPSLYSFDVFQLVDATKKHHRKLALYGADMGCNELRECPHCGGTELQPLRGIASQPLIGFVSPDIALYVRCLTCGLGFMTPQVAIDRTESIYDAFDFADSATNYAAHEAPLSLKQKSALAMAEPCLRNGSVVLDLGGGTGRFAYRVKMLHPDWRVVHSDFDARSQEFLRESGIETRSINVVADPLGSETFDLITAFEVIEHLDYMSFTNLVKKVHLALKSGGSFVFTTPDIDSPLVMAFDFFNAYAPHHLLLFGRRWLTEFFADPSRGFKVAAIASGGDLLDDHSSYFGYYAETSPSTQLQAGAHLLRTLLANEANRALLLERDMGSEVIMLLQKH
jgi:SAM-dependent methyltransferase